MPEVQSSSSPAINIEKHQGIDQFVSSELHGEPSGLGDTKSTIKQRKQVRYQDTEITMPEESGQSGSAQNNRGDLHSKGTDQDTNQLLPPTDPNHQNNDRAFRPPTGTHRTPDVDFKAFKYRRKSIAQRIKRLLQNHYSSQKYYEPIMGQTTPILVTLVIVVALVFIWMSTSVVRHHRNDYDPVLDPYRNPNIKIGNGQVKV